MEAEVSEDGSTGEEGAAHAGEKMPMGPIGWAVRLRHMIGLLYHLTVYLKQKCEEKSESVVTFNNKQTLAKKYTSIPFLMFVKLFLIKVP